MTSAEQLLNGRSFSHHFQPIYNLATWRKIGYEVLLRPACSLSPEEAFQLAEAEEKLYELDTLSIQKAVEYYNNEGYTSRNGMLFINVFPSTISNPLFLSFIEKLTTQFQQSQNLILELNESERIEDYIVLNKALQNIRKLGIKVAIDDFGKRYSDIASLVELKPDYVKLDRYLISNLEQSKEKQFIVNCIKKYCAEFHTKLIIEGIERPNELALAKYLGIPLAQGNVLSPPEDLNQY
ncbi:EAL domain-containing protein [Halobacillus campisalis]|uniref:EAL domain-containing protein n=1 Tax=Halobacillus campisalis TaxID=435909 RepID=A0ABW2K550_9BACI|nr:EAL domain-containing protein [Halobacillus campisalis]